MTKTQAMTRREQQPPAPRTATLEQYLEKVLPKLAEVAPKSFDMTAFVPKLLQRAQRNPQLLACTHASIFLALHESLQLGLEALSPHGHYWLVPRRNKHNNNALEACGQLGYKGMIELAMRSGRVNKVDIELIYEGEEFHFDRATGEIRHPFKFGIDKSPEKIIGGYAIAELSTGARVPRVLERDDFEKAKRLAQSDKFWGPYYAEMSMGVCVRRLFGRGQVPMTKELAEQFAREDEREKAAEWQEIPVAQTVKPSLPEPDPLAQSLEHDVIAPDAEAPPSEPAADPDHLQRRLDVLLAAAEGKGLGKWLTQQARERFGHNSAMTCSLAEIEELIEAVEGEAGR